MSLERLIQLVRDGEPVKAGTPNRPLREIDQNVRYVWEVLQAASVGSTVYARRVTVESGALVGMPVYYNATRQRFELGLAQLDSAVTQGALLTSETAQVWGVVGAKINDTLADVLLFGYETLDVSAAVTGGVASGVYYLSGVTPGRLTRQRPPVSVPVLRSDGSGRVYVFQQFVDFIDRHVHYRFALTCAPAGHSYPPTPGDRHGISDADDTLPGWLPAGHASFAGKAPDGAAFGYNLAADTQLRDAWPPLPTSGASLEWSKGLDKSVGYTGVPTGPGGLCVLDRNGVWWMSDCYGDVPWPIDYDSGVSESYSDGADVECPRNLLMEMRLYFTKFQFATETTVVRSLTSTDDRVLVKCADGTEASAGDLVVSLDLDLTVSQDAEGYLAIKEFEADTGEFKRGPVVEGLYATSDNVSLSGTASGTRAIDGVDREVHQGLVAVSVDPDSSRELDVQLIRLDSVEEQFYQDTTYLGFPAGEQSELRCKIHIPADTGLASPTLSLRFRLMGRAAGVLPDFEFSGRRLPRPSGGLVTPAALPLLASEFTIACDTGATLASANQYVEATSDPFDVAAGDVVFFTVRRLSDAYSAEVGLLQQVGILTAGA